MEHLDLLNKIIEAEQQASLISSAAKQKRDDLPNELRQQQEQLRAEYLDRAEKRIMVTQQQAAEESEARIAQLTQALDEQKARIAGYFEAHHDRMIEELFSLVVSPE